MPAVTLLVADSSPGELQSVRAALSNRGYRLLSAGTGTEAQRLLAEEEVNILLLGATLGDADGYQLCSRVREEHRQVPLQVLVLQPASGPADVARALDAGADDSLRLPCDPEELAARVRAAVARWQAQAGLIKEREFYRIAVAEEERLSSLVLDQNQSLKAAYEKIRQLNGELEKANRELEQLAAYDALSGLLNRRTLFSRIGVEIERATRMNVPLTGLMVDIDRFKSINDNFGHPCGDLVIREIGVKLQNRLRKYDFAGRYGGEEFFVLLSNSTEVQAERIGDRFRREMAETRFTCNAESFAVTLSIGVARFRDGDTQDSWIESADRALYRAKEAGRNRVVIA
ncbi:MAG: diguanylate cyclase [Spirochaetes bacterium]|nr:diguanylate cyclase [Spirochaetota bacterium]